MSKNLRIQCILFIFVAVILILSLNKFYFLQKPKTDIHPSWKSSSVLFLSLKHPASWSITQFDSNTLSIESSEKIKKYIKVKKLNSSGPFDSWCNFSLCGIYQPYKKTTLNGYPAYISLNKKLLRKAYIVIANKVIYSIVEGVEMTAFGDNIQLEKKSLHDPVMAGIVSTFIFHSKYKKYDTPVKIMPLGDSLTAFYQPFLYQKLRAHYPHVIFVGDLKDIYAPSSQHHEGHFGWTIDRLNTHIKEWLLFYEPKIILLMAGTNDIARNIDATNADIRLEQLINTIRMTEPNSYLLVASILPMNLSSKNDYETGIARTNFYNMHIENIVRKKSLSDNNIFFVNIHETLTERDLLDGIHPKGPAEYEQMADKWQKVLLPLLNTSKD